MTEVSPRDIYFVVRTLVEDFINIIDENLDLYRGRNILNILKDMATILRSILSRAENAPAQHASWGYEAFIAYILSHAAKALDITPNYTLEEYIKKKMGVYNPKDYKLGDEKIGYILYSYILYQIIVSSNRETRPRCLSPTKVLIGLADTVLSTNNNALYDFERIQTVLEYVKRYTTIILEPILNYIGEVTSSRRPSQEQPIRHVDTLRKFLKGEI